MTISSHRQGELLRPVGRSRCTRQRALNVKEQSLNLRWSSSRTSTGTVGLTGDAQFTSATSSASTGLPLRPQL